MASLWRLGTALLVLVACRFARAQEIAETPRWYGYGFVGKNLKILGSEDPREGEGFGLGYERRDRRFDLQSARGNISWELYYHLTEGGRVRTTPPISTQAWGVLALGRWYWPERRMPMYAEVGFGFQHVSHTTRDLDSKLNSTPVFGAGFLLGSRPDSIQLGLRFMHVSNAGQRGDNQGLNQLLVIAFVPF